MAIISKNTILWELQDKVTGPLDRIAEGTTRAKQALENAKFTVQSSGNDLEKLGHNAGDSARSFQEGFQKITGSTKEGAQGIIEFSSSKNQFHQAAEAIKGDNQETAKSFTDGTAALKSAKTQIHEVTEQMEKMPKDKKTHLSVVADDKKVQEFSEQVKKTPREKETTFKAKVSDAIAKVKGLGDEEEETGRKSNRLKDVLLGTFAGNLIAGGIAAITGKLHEAIQAGEEYNKEQDVMKTVWHSLTTEAPKDGQQLIDFINDVGQHSIYASDNVNKMAQSFYHVHSNVAETKRWTNDFIALGSTLHMTGDQVSEAAEMFAKMQASGKVGAEDMAVMINRFPMFGEAIQKASGKSMAELYKLSSQGKLSADVFSKTLDELGEKYKSGTNEAMGSAMGMGMYISSRMAKLSGDVQKSSFELSKGVQHDIQSILSDGSLEKMANGVSKALGGMMAGVAKVVSYIASHKDTIVDIIGNMKTLLGIFASTIWDTAKSVIGNIADVFGKLSGSAGKSKDPLKNVNTILKELVDHKEAVQVFAKVLLGVFAVKKATAFAKSIKNVSSAIGLIPNANGKIGLLGKALGGASKGAASLAKTLGGGLLTAVKSLGATLLTNPIFWIAAIIIGVGVAFYEAYKHIKPFRDAVNSLGSGIKKFASGAVKSVKKFASEAGKNFDKFKKDASEKLGKAGKAFKKVGSAAKSGLKSTVSFVKKDWKELGALIVNPIAGATLLLYKHNPKFKKWADGLMGDVKGVFTKGVAAMKKDIVNPVKKHWQNMQDDVDDFKKSANKTFDKFQDDTEKTFNSLKKNVGKTVSRFRDDVADKFQNAKDRANKTADQLHDGVSSTFESLRKNTGSKFSAIRSFVTDHMEGSRKNSTSLAGRLHDGVMNWWENLRKGTISKWQSMLSFVASIPGKMGSALSNGAHWVGDGAKAVGNYMVGKIGDGVNGVIGGIDWVLDKVHAPKSIRIPKWDIPKFATGGTHRGGLMMVNDGDGEELVRHPDGRMEIPKGRDVIMNAEPGTQVLNHSQTKVFAAMAGIPMYAEGIGSFFSGLWDDVKNIGEEVTDAVSHPVKFMKKAIANHVKLDATHPVLDIGKGAVKTMATGAEKWIQGIIDKYGKELLDSMGAGSGSRGQFLKIAEQQGDKPYVWGAEGPNAFDCSGLVKWALSQVGVNFPHFSGSQFSATSPVEENKAKPGDLAFYGPGGTEHVGIVTGKNKMFAAQSPSSHPNIGPDSIHNGLPFVGIRRINQLNDGNGGSVSSPGGSGVARWRGQVRDALAANGLPTSPDYINAWMAQINTESSGNEKARQGIIDVNSSNGSGGAMGLLQTIPPTFNAFKLPGHGDIFNGYDNMLAAMNYAKHAYGGNMLGVIGHGHGYQEGGNPKKRQLSWLSEDGEEFVINPKKPNALSLAFNALKSIEREQPALAGVSQYDYNPGSYGAAEGQQMAANVSKQNGGTWISDKLDRVIDYLETIAAKDGDVYIDADKVTDHINHTNTKRLDILQTIN